MSQNNVTAALIGVPLDLGSQNIGAAQGPQALKNNKLIEKLKHTGITVEDMGDLQVQQRQELSVTNPRLLYSEEIINIANELANRTEAIIRSNKKAIILGGDHSINLGSFSGASTAVNGELGMIYIDAHPDINTSDTTLTGAIHGMHLAALMGFGAPELINVHGKQTKLAKENLLHIGASDCDQAELDLIKKENLEMFTLFDLLTYNLEKLWTAIDKLTARVSNIWVSIDLDAIDKTYAPGVSLPNDKGLTYREIATIAEYIGSHCNVIGLDLVEYNPSHDSQNKTAELGIGLIAKFLGKSYSSYAEYVSHHHVS